MLAEAQQLSAVAMASTIICEASYATTAEGNSNRARGGIEIVILTCPRIQGVNLQMTSVFPGQQQKNGWSAREPGGPLVVTADHLLVAMAGV